MLRNVLLITSLIFLAGCHTVRPELNAYEGLMPAGHHLKQSSEKLDISKLNQKTLAIVTSANFNNYMNYWNEKFNGNSTSAELISSAQNVIGTNGTASPYLGAITPGLIESGHARIGAACDPRKVIERTVSFIKPYFKEIKSAVDFSDAKGMKSDYILLVDYYADFNSGLTVYLTRGSLILLDSTLQPIYESTGKADVDREPGFTLIPPTPSQVIQYEVNTVAKGTDITTNQMISSFRQKIGPPPSPAPIIAKDSRTGTDKLKELKSLLDSGVITHKDFEIQKQKILDSGI